MREGRVPRRSPPKEDFAPRSDEPPAHHLGKRSCKPGTAREHERISEQRFGGRESNRFQTPAGSFSGDGSRVMECRPLIGHFARDTTARIGGTRGASTGLKVRGPNVVESKLRIMPPNLIRLEHLRFHAVLGGQTTSGRDRLWQRSRIDDGDVARRDEELLLPLLLPFAPQSERAQDKTKVNLIGVTGVDKPRQSAGSRAGVAGAVGVDQGDARSLLE